ncbi:hypothetical protein F66182_6040 [Fusarium sp. NRRL 66182]|nr:hypothetical protein F66182_6040 [Fusarium sp. NRRL 66182]
MQPSWRLFHMMVIVYATPSLTHFLEPLMTSAVIEARHALASPTPTHPRQFYPRAEDIPTYTVTCLWELEYFRFIACEIDTDVGLARTKCLQQDEALDTDLCDDVCQSNTYNLLCTNATAPYCRTYAYPKGVRDYECAPTPATRVSSADFTHNGEKYPDFDISTYVDVDGTTVQLFESLTATDAESTATESSSGESQNEGKGNSLSGGAIAGIATAGMVVLASIGLGFWFFRRWKRRQSQSVNPTTSEPARPVTPKTPEVRVVPRQELSAMRLSQAIFPFYQDINIDMSLQFTTLDVFTSTAYKGNPLAVVTIPPPSQGLSLTQSQKQRIAHEFNLSETVFVHDVDDSHETNEREMDIFTPDRELPFAGHPTIGTAVSLQPLGVKTLIAKAGRIELDFDENNSARAAIPHNVRLHSKRLTQPEYEVGSDDKLAQVATAEDGGRLFSIVKGMTFALIELPSLELLSAVKIGAMGYISGDLQDEGWQHDFDSRRYYFVLLDRELSSDGKQLVQSLRTRMVKRTMEDPATGSAACALPCYLALHVLSAESIRFKITQGVEMGRESLIVVDVKVETDGSGERKVKTVHLGGRAVEVMKGALQVPV